jgi:putative methyltransferase (TIGR04325 family)
VNLASLFESLTSCLRRKNPKQENKPTVSYVGNYAHWADAVADSKGYEDSEIIKKATQSFEEILAGKHKCERDTFLYDEFQYSLPLLLGLNFMQRKVGKIQLLDFGGSFASSYFRNLDVVQEFDLSWTVIEQKRVVQKARGMTTGCDKLLFFEERELERLISKRAYNIILLGSCLQFLEKPNSVVSKLLHDELQTVVIEQTPVIQKDISKLTVQHVGKPLYESSYPAWHFAEKELLSWFKDDFQLKYRFNGPHVINRCDGFYSQLEDYVFTRNE